MLADTAYDSNDLRSRIAAMKAEAVIPSERNRKVSIPHDVEVYKHRHRLEHVRCFATRHDRCTIHFAGFVHFAAAMIQIE